MAEREERCDRCRWWDRMDEDPIGLCRRYAARPAVFVQGSTDPQPGLIAWWPQTEEDDFCGEFRPRDPRGFPG